MNATTVLVLLLGATAQRAAEHARNDQAPKAISQQLLELHTDENTFNYDAKHRYRFYRDRIILELSDTTPIQKVK